MILLHRPDILVIQECEHPDKLVFNSETQQPKDILWFGDNKHKGLGVFSYNNYRFQLVNDYNEDLKIICPITVTGGLIDFALFAIWANNRHDQDGQYIEQVWKAVNHYDNLLTNGSIILAGDFNSNTIWDRQHRIGNHSAVVEMLEKKNIYSIYHRYLNQEQGSESHPTFYLQRKKDKPYHIDYCFASVDLYDKVQNIEIGAYDDWASHSDHIPLIINFDM